MPTGGVTRGEVGDKTQLLAIRFRKPVPIVLGILIAALPHADRNRCTGCALPRSVNVGKLF